MEKAVKCSGKRCKAVFHINEHRELGGINDKGYIVVKCNKCGKLTKIRMLNPPRFGFFDNFEIVDSWEDGEGGKYENVMEGEVALVSGKEPAEGVPLKFKPNKLYPFWQNAGSNLEKIAYNHFKRASTQINDILHGLKMVYLKSMPGYDEIERCVVRQEYTHEGRAFTATWGKILKYENTMNSDNFQLIDHSDNQKCIDGVYSRNEMMNYLYRCLMRWKLVANQVVVVTPFIGFDFPFSKQKDKEELIGLWELLNSVLDVEKTLFVTRVSSYSSLKKYQKQVDVPADVLAEWDLMNNLQSMVHNPKTRVKTKAQFHAKFYAGIFDDHVELLSGSFNVQTGNVLEQMHLRNVTRELFKENYLDRLVNGFEYDDGYNPKTMFIDIDEDGKADYRITELNNKG